MSHLQRALCFTLLLNLYTTQGATYPSSGFCGTHNITDDSSGYLLDRVNVTEQEYLHDLDCLWRIKSSDPTQRIKLTFEILDTECGYDFVSIFDGRFLSGSESLDDQPEQIAKLCGQRTNTNTSDVFLSNGNELTIRFKSDALIASKGIKAKFEILSPSNLCNRTSDCLNSGSCISGKCSCTLGYAGAFCQSTAAKFGKRIGHTAVYSKARDKMYVYGGNDLQIRLLKQEIFLEYDFLNQTWRNLSMENSPGPLSSHYSFIYNDQLYVWGGIRKTFDKVEFDQTHATTLYRYDLTSGIWSSIITAGTLPRTQFGFSASMVTEQGKLYVLGGQFRENYQILISPGIFAYTFATNTWSLEARFELGDIVTSSAGMTVSSQAIYHPGTNTIFSFFPTRPGYNTTEGRAIYGVRYSIDTRLPVIFDKETRNNRVGFRSGAAVAVWDEKLDRIIVQGGEAIVTDLDCYDSQIHIYDVACDRWEITSSTEYSIPLSSRAYHASIVRNSSLVSVGGLNGVLLGDVVTIPLPSSGFQSEEKRKKCQESWCTNWMYDCKDCLNVRGCSFCDGSCSSSPKGDAAKCTLDQTTCPNPVYLFLFEKYSLLLNPGSSESIKTYIAPVNYYGFTEYTDYDNTDLMIKVTSYSSNSITTSVRLNSPLIFGEDLKGSISPNVDKLIIPRINRKPGIVLYTLSNPDLVSTVSLQFQLTTAPTSSSDWFGLSFITFLILSGTCLISLFALTYGIKKIRDRQRIQAFVLQTRENPILPPDWFDCSLVIPASWSWTVKVDEMLVANVGATSSPTVVHGTVKGPARDSPASMETFFYGPLPHTMFTAVNYYILLPGAEDSVREGVLPPAAIGSVVHAYHMTPREIEREEFRSQIPSSVQKRGTR